MTIENNMRVVCVFKRDVENRDKLRKVLLIKNSWDKDMREEKHKPEW